MLDVRLRDKAWVVERIRAPQVSSVASGRAETSSAWSWRLPAAPTSMLSSNNSQNGVTSGSARDSKTERTPSCFRRMFAAHVTELKHTPGAECDQSHKCETGCEQIRTLAWRKDRSAQNRDGGDTDRASQMRCIKNTLKRMRVGRRGWAITYFWPATGSL